MSLTLPALQPHALPPPPLGGPTSQSGMAAVAGGVSSSRSFLHPLACPSAPIPGSQVGESGPLCGGQLKASRLEGTGSAPWNQSTLPPSTSSLAQSVCPPGRAVSGERPWVGAPTDTDPPLLSEEQVGGPTTAPWSQPSCSSEPLAAPPRASRTEPSRCPPRSPSQGVAGAHQRCREPLRLLRGQRVQRPARAQGPGWEGAEGCGR